MNYYSFDDADAIVEVKTGEYLYVWDNEDGTGVALETSIAEGGCIMLGEMQNEIAGIYHDAACKGDVIRGMRRP